MYERLRSKKLATSLVVLAGALGIGGCGSNSASVSKEELKTKASLRSSIMPAAQEIADQMIALSSHRHLTSGTQKTVKSTSHGTEINLFYAGPILDKGSAPFKPDHTDDQVNQVTVYFQNKHGAKPTKDEVEEVIVYEYDYATQDRAAGIGPAISTDVLYAPSVLYDGKKEWAASDNYNSTLVDTVNHPSIGIANIETAQQIVGLTTPSFDVATEDFTGS